MEKVRLWDAIRHSIRCSFSILWSYSKSVYFVCILAVIMRVALPFLSILMPKVVLDQITAFATPQRFFIVVGSMALALVIVNFLKSFTDRTVDTTIGIVVQTEVLLQDWKKTATMDFEQMENPEFKKAQDKAEKAAYSNRAPAMNVAMNVVELLSNSFGFLLYAGAIAFIHPLILLVLLITAAVNWLMLSRARKYMEKTRDERSKQTKRLTALRDTLIKPEAAKDIRLYGALGWLYALYRREYAAYRKNERSVMTKDMQAQLVDALLILLRDAAAYAFLIWLVLNGRMSLGDFVFIFAAVGALAGWVSGILTAAGDLSKASIELSDIQDKQDFPDKMNTGTGIALPSGDRLPPSIEFRNVSYTYPNAEKAALSDINITINAGERIAIVGANGAGKTTLIKLLCGMYVPSSGEVLLAGSPVGEYNRDEYYTLFSAVFQDIHLLASSISENISQKSEELTDKEKIKRSLELSGLVSKTDTLPDKENTLLVRAVYPDAIELSGGEKQKLAMARALYKDAPVLILDEPTAALDPLAENEVYQKYAELTEGKTSVFISHRLASTRFCDRILLLDGNIVAEQGTHDELMAQDGVYANMFNIQASYYQTDNKEP
ncbi:MAG: ABC transporter ATP-binding protein/permease [Oscillospiraceae bacterium]|nr:ABC transporter ATP-binding protein/permease [Oscillospiraceae bacterium]